jgi:hypothetical protein
MRRFFHPLSFIVVLLAGCGDRGVQSYRVPKEEHHHAPVTDTPSSTPQLQWQTPADWQEQPPSSMRVASFKVGTAEGKQADVSVIPLSGPAGGDLSNVNRWRGQVGLPPVTEAELPQLAQAVEVAGQPAQLFHLAGSNLTILAVAQLRAGTTWFFKMTGDSAFVAEQKPSFVAFLKSVQFAAGKAETADAGRPQWSVPAGWKEAAAGQFLVAKFEVGAATVNVSQSAGTGGGVAANVNRWREQLGLPASPDAPPMPDLAVAGATAKMVELTSEKAALVAVIVSRSDVTWFYKLMGSPATVAEQKAAFVKFVQGVKY